MTINNKIVSEFQEIKSLYDAGKTRFAVRNGAYEKVIVREDTNDGEKYTVELREIVSKNRTNLLTQTTFNISRKGELKKDYSNFKTAVFGTKTVKMASAEKPSVSASVPKKAVSTGKSAKVGINEEINRLEEKLEKKRDTYGAAMAKGYSVAKAWTKEYNDLVDKIYALKEQKRTGQLQVERTHIKEEPVASAKKSSGQTKKPVAPVKEAAEELTSRGLSAPVSPKVQAYEEVDISSLPEATIMPIEDFVEERKRIQQQQMEQSEKQAEQKFLASSLNKNDPEGILNEYKSLCSLTEGGEGKPLGGGVYSNRQSVVLGNREIESVAKENWLKDTTLTRAITVTERSPEGTTTTSYAFRLIDEATGKHRITKLSYGPRGEDKIIVENGVIIKDEGGA